MIGPGETAARVWRETLSTRSAVDGNGRNRAALPDLDPSLDDEPGASEAGNRRRERRRDSDDQNTIRGDARSPQSRRRPRNAACRGAARPALSARAGRSGVAGIARQDRTATNIGKAASAARKSRLYCAIPPVPPNASVTSARQDRPESRSGAACLEHHLRPAARRQAFRRRRPAGSRIEPGAGRYAETRLRARDDARPARRARRLRERAACRRPPSSPA